MTLSELLRQEPRPGIIKRAGFSCWRVIVSNDDLQWQMRHDGGSAWRDSSASFCAKDILADDWEAVKE